MNYYIIDKVRFGLLLFFLLLLPACASFSSRSFGLGAANVTIFSKNDVACRVGGMHAT